MNQYVKTSEADILTFNTQQTFKQGLQHKAITFDLPFGSTTFMFRLGYCLWGMDIWIDKVPMIKLMIAANIVNMVVMWMVK